MIYKRTLELFLVLLAIATAGVLVIYYASSPGCLCPLAPNNSAHELVAMEGSRLNSNSNLTLYLRNVGTLNFTLSAYYVGDSSGNQFDRSNWWLGPNPQTSSTGPNALAAATILIGATCGTSCVNAGQAFAFESGHSYDIRIVTARNSLLHYNVTV